MERTNSRTQLVIHLFFVVVSAVCLLPFFLLVTSSITDESEIIRNGYTLFPKHISFAAYEYLLNDASAILRAYGNTFVATVIGTSVSLLIITMLAYPLSRRDFPWRKSLSFFVFFTMLFNGGLVPTYFVYTQVFDLKNTLLALIVPYLLLNGFYVLLARTFFANTIPMEIIESAYIDGAGEFRIFWRIILPLSLPILATVGLFQLINYWNDWFNSLIFITDRKLFNLQYLLNKILLDIQFLSTSDLGGNQAEMIAALPKEGVRMAMAVIGVVPILIAYPFFQRFFIQGLTVGAVKG
ncbi:carbohydrate ABC transporter permease [Cohnella laeviribosi]|uniref:carbohydrate ABC transporter permease n=1 Tax=Cohnella laeviribosi TaxID=380174 RepID=UPI0003654F5D|nr:carbohydrate ABC transporter permease [Cohnella laeviribosi]